MSRFGMTRVAAAVVCSLVLAGCGDSAGPDEFDVGAMQADLAFFDLGQTDDEEALQRTLDEIDNGTTAVLIRSRTSQPRVLFSRGSTGISLSRAPLPDSVLGKTWEWDAVEDDYVLSERSGAPSDGTRYIVYEVEGFEIVEPVVEIGYVDIRDIQQGSRREARLTAVVNDVTQRDYTAFATGDETSGEIGASGFLLLSGVRINVDGSGTISPTGIAFESHVEVPSRDLEMDITVNGSFECCDFSVDMSLEGSAGRLDVTGTSDDEGSTYTFALNGEDFALHEMPMTDPDIWTALGGNTITPEHEDLFLDVEDMSLLGVLPIVEMASPVIQILSPVPDLF